MRNIRMAAYGLITSGINVYSYITRPVLETINGSFFQNLCKAPGQSMDLYQQIPSGNIPAFDESGNKTPLILLK